MTDRLALTYAELEILIDGLTDDVAFEWVVTHLGLKMESNLPPDGRTIDEVFIHVEKLIANGLVRIGRTEYIDGGPPGRVAPVKLVEEPIALVEDRVRSSCSTASDWADWAFAFWLVTTDSGDEIARWALQLAISWAIEEGIAVARSDAGHLWRLRELGPVVDLTAFTGSNDCVVVLDWEHRPAEVLPWHPYSNLVRLRPDGVVVWRSTPPPSETLKSWTSVNESDGKLVAHAWSTRCDVNAETGVITGEEFVK